MIKTNCEKGNISKKDSLTTRSNHFPFCRLFRSTDIRHTKNQEF